MTRRPTRHLPNRPFLLKSLSTSHPAPLPAAPSPWVSSVLPRQSCTTPSSTQSRRLISSAPAPPNQSCPSRPQTANLFGPPPRHVTCQPLRESIPLSFPRQASSATSPSASTSRRHPRLQIKTISMTTAGGPRPKRRSKFCNLTFHHLSSQPRLRICHQGSPPLKPRKRSARPCTTCCHVYSRRGEHQSSRGPYFTACPCQWALSSRSWPATHAMPMAG